MPPLALPGSEILSWLYQKNVLTAVRAVVTQTDIKKRKKDFTSGNRCRDVVVLWDIHADVSGPHLAMNGEQFPPRTAIIGMEKGGQHGNNGKIGINSDLWARAESRGGGGEAKSGRYISARKWHVTKDSVRGICRHRGRWCLYTHVHSTKYIYCKPASTMT